VPAREAVFLRKAAGAVYSCGRRERDDVLDTLMYGMPDVVRPTPEVMSPPRPQLL
jgi:hypothetical protein